MMIVRIVGKMVRTNKPRVTKRLGYCAKSSVVKSIIPYKKLSCRLQVALSIRSITTVETIAHVDVR